MTKQRRTFFAEFKLEATNLVLDQGYTVSETSHSLGVSENVLRRWVNQLKQERGGQTPSSKALTPEQQKIQEVEARINRLEREKSILKNVWSAPELQERLDSRSRLRQCIRPICEQSLCSGLDGIRTSPS